MGLETIRPNAAGDYTEFGVLVDATHHGALGDINDATYIEGTAAGQRDLFNCPASSIPDHAKIAYVQIHSRAYTSAGLFHNFQAMLKSGVTEKLYPHGLTVTITTYDDIKEYVSIDTGKAWTKAEIDAIQIGARNNSAHDNKVCDVWLTVYYYYSLHGQILSEFAAPTNSIGGIAFDGIYLWIVEYNADTIKQYDRRGNLIMSFSHAATSPLGIEVIGDQIYVGDHVDHKMYIYNRKGDLIKSAAIGAIHPAQMYFDGVYLWIMDFDNNQVHQCTPDLTLIKSISVSSTEHISMASNGVGLYCASTDNNRIIKRLKDWTLIESFSHDGNYPRGLCFDGMYWWIADEGDDKVYQIML